MRRSDISWTDFSGGNLNLVWRGRNDCKISPGCDNCYVDRCYSRMGSKWKDHTTFYPDKLAKLSKAKFKEGNKPFRRGKGSRPMAFLCDTGDLFHYTVPDEFIKKVFQALYARLDVDWQVLTKRPERLYEISNQDWWYPSPNVWIGVTVENQEYADKRIPYLLKVPAVVRFLSVEPMLGEVNIRAYISDTNYDYWCGDWPIYPGDQTIRWVICGGESGSKARLMEAKWVKLLADHCDTLGISFFFKQWGWATTSKVRDTGRILYKHWPDVSRELFIQYAVDSYAASLRC